MKRELMAAGMLGVALVAVLALRGPCSHGVARMFESMDQQPDGGVIRPKLTRPELPLPSSRPTVLMEADSGGADRPDGSAFEIDASSH